MLVWIHGGAYESGSSSQYNGTAMVAHMLRTNGGAILVTLDYRLNVFGFLGSEALRSRDAEGSSGNCQHRNRFEPLHLKPHCRPSSTRSN